MGQKIKWFFLMLVIIQGLHSMEEYIGKLWESFPPARFICRLVSENLEIGFLVINVGLFVFGSLCWLFPIRGNYFCSGLIIWCWIIIELANGIGHPIWSFDQKTYTPGILTAPILFIIAIYMLRLQLIKNVKYTY